MKFKLIYVLLFVLSISFAFGFSDYDNLKDISLINISNCYNATISLSLTDGSAVPVYFRDCSSIGTDKWFCNCKSDFYTLVMRTNNGILREPRKYEIDIEAFVYAVDDVDSSFKIYDWGDYAELKGSKLDKLEDLPTCQTSHCSDKVEFIYFNKTIEVPVIEYRDVIKETIKEVYVENTSRIDECNLKLNKSNEDNKVLLNESNTCNSNLVKEHNIVVYRNLIILILAIIIIGLIYYILKKR